MPGSVPGAENVVMKNIGEEQFSVTEILVGEMDFKHITTQMIM